MSTLPQSDRPTSESFLAQLLPSTLYTAVSVVICGVVYPLLVTLFAQLFWHDQANGSLIRDSRGIVVGSALTGQSFSAPRYFHMRPSAAGNGYDPMASGGTNLGPTSKKLIESTRAAIVSVMKENPGEISIPPADLVTSSASGLDPDITPESAAYQIRRVAHARGLREEAVRQLVSRYTYDRDFAIFGEPRVDVLRLNLALDRR